MPYTLLLADDSVTIQRVIELTFADEDVRVIAVSDGDQAIAELDAHPPDIVLADVGMPGKNGYEVARYIRQSPRLQHIPIVLLTGAFEPVDQERAAEAGCDGVLAKPFEPQLVIERVKELLARTARPAAAGALWTTPTTPTTPTAPTAPRAPAARPAAAGKPAAPAPATDDYFDKLDAAFATLANAPAPAAPQLSPLPSGPPQTPTSDIDWFASQLNSPAAAAAGGPELWDLPGPAATSEPDDLPLKTVETSVADDLNITETGAEVLGAEVLSAVQGAEVLRAAPEPVAPQHTAPQHSARHEAPQHPAPQHRVEPPAPQHEAPPPAPQHEAPRQAPRHEAPPPAPQHEAPRQAPRHEAPHQAPQHPAPQHPIALPSIADAFAALLAAEANDPRPLVAPVWPVAGSSMPPPPPPVDIEDLVDRVTRRVIDRLGDAVIRDAVADATSLIAERLVIEEIERIKSSIK